MDLIAVLQQDPEPFPEWLRELSPAFDRAAFFGSRTVYYPGSGADGQPAHSGESDRAERDQSFRSKWSPVGAKRRGCWIMSRGDQFGSMVGERIDSPFRLSW